MMVLKIFRMVIIIIFIYIIFFFLPGIVVLHGVCVCVFYFLNCFNVIK